MKVPILIAVLLGTIGLATAQETAGPSSRPGPNKRPTPLRLVPAQQAKWRTPHPPGIPEQFSPPQEVYAAFPERAGAPPEPKPSGCQLRLAQIAVFKPLPVLMGPGECGAVDAVALDGVLLPDHGSVPLNPPAMLRCAMAEAVAMWLREDVAPVALKLGSPLRGVDNFNSYECRGRNRVRGATLSEHGRANALDVRGFRLANGETMTLTDVDAAKDWREAIRASVCARFSTVLGPGSDGNHENHIHLDLAERHGDYKICEWEIREPANPIGQAEASPSGEKLESVPLPRPRPIANAAGDPSLPTKKMRLQLR